MLRKTSLILIGMLVLGIPFLARSNYLIHLVNVALIFCLLAVSLNIVLGYAGQLSLGHAALFGIGAYTAALLTAGATGLLFWPGFIAAGLVTGLAGLLIGIPTLRLRGHYLALATLGFGEIMRYIFFNWREVTHGMDGIAGIPAPSLGFLVLASDRSFFYLALAVLACVMVATIRFERSKYGRQLAAIRDSELAAGTIGVNVSQLKIIAFGLSAIVAGFAGSLYAHLTTFISPDVFVFDVTAQLLSMVLIGGIGATWGPIMGAVLLTFLPEILRISKAYYQLIYGAGIALLVIFLPTGISGLFSRLTYRVRPAGRTELAAEATNIPLAPAIAGRKREAARAASDSQPIVALETRGMSCRFGGLVALDNVNLAIEQKTIHALIGPNGSGKSTFINVVSGIYRAASGAIVFNGTSIQGLRPWKITELGMARTFQNIKLFNRMTVLQNVVVAAHVDSKAGWLSMFLHSRAACAEEEHLYLAAEEALRFVGLWHQRHQLAAQLPHEMQRMVEIARAFVRSPSMIMLDEPAAGLNPSETERLVGIIEQMRQCGTTVLLVEHNMPFVMRLADQVTVLNFGRKIAEGDPASVRSNEEVIKAYLGARLSKRLSRHGSS